MVEEEGGAECFLVVEDAGLRMAAIEGFGSRCVFLPETSRALGTDCATLSIAVVVLLRQNTHAVFTNVRIFCFFAFISRLSLPDVLIAKLNGAGCETP